MISHEVMRLSMHIPDSSSPHRRKEIDIRGNSTDNRIYNRKHSALFPHYYPSLLFYTTFFESAYNGDEKGDTAVGEYCQCECP